MQGQYASRPLHGWTTCWADLKLLTLDASPLRAARRCRLNDCVPAHLTLGPAGHNLHFSALAGCAMAQHADALSRKICHMIRMLFEPQAGAPNICGATECSVYAALVMPVLFSDWSGSP